MLAVAMTELSLNDADLSVAEWQIVINELQNSLDDFMAFSNQN